MTTGEATEETGETVVEATVVVVMTAEMTAEEVATETATHGMTDDTTTAAANTVGVMMTFAIMVVAMAVIVAEGVVGIVVGVEEAEAVEDEATDMALRKDARRPQRALFPSRNVKERHLVGIYMLQVMSSILPCRLSKQVCTMARTVSYFLLLFASRSLQLAWCQ